MKKRVLFVLWVTAILFGCNTLKYLDHEGYVSNPKTIKGMAYQIVHLEKDSLKKEPAMGFLVFYDYKGRKTKEVDLDKFGNIEGGKRLYSYDKYGNIVEKLSFNADSTLLRQEEFTYVKRGSQLRASATVLKNKRSTSNYTYTKTKDGMIRRSSVSKKGNTGIKKYDRKGQEIAFTVLDSTQQQVSKWEFDYDRKGNKIVARHYDPYDGLLELYAHEYDDTNHLIGTRQYKVVTGDTILSNQSRVAYEFDKRGNPVVERHYDKNGRQLWSFESEITYW